MNIRTLSNSLAVPVKNISIIFYLAVLIIYILIRGYAWNQNFLLEDTDSISYLSKAKVFLELDYQKIRNGGVDTTPVYPFFSALFSAPGWSIETGARLCSMVFSSVLFFAITMIGMKVADRTGVLIGLLILALSPIMISLSFSVLSEPSYIATIYLGIGIYILYYKNSSISMAILLGVIFGLGFLNRTEGIIYLAVIPVLHFAQCFFKNDIPCDYKKLIRFNLLYILSFLILIAPQIYYVSGKMGRLAMNGREAWMLILHQPDGKSYDEKIYGLDYSDREINRKYVQKHPEIQKLLYSNISGSFKRYIRDIIKEFGILYNTQLGTLIGPLGFIFFAFGLSDLYQRRYFFEIIFFIGFMIASLIPPLMHDVDMRHIAIIAPMIMLIEGIGVMQVSESLSASLNRSYTRYIFPIIFLLIIFVPSAMPLYKMYQNEPNADEVSQYYNNRGNYLEPVSVVKSIAQNEMKRKPVILSRHSHLSYFADGDFVFIPYTDYDGLVRYSILNNVDFLFLQYRYLDDFPFLERFKENNTPDFKKIFEKMDFRGEKIELYRILRGNN